MSYQQFGRVDPEERLDHSEEPEGEEYPRRRLLPWAMRAGAVMALCVGVLAFGYHLGSRHTTAPAVATASGAPAPAGGVANDQVPLIQADPGPVKVKPDKAGGMNIPDRDDPLYQMRPGAAPAEHILPPPEPPAPRPTAPPPQVAAVPPAAQAAPLPAPGPPAVQAKPVAGTVKVQIASLRTPDQARTEWTRLKRDNDDLLGHYTAVAVRADLGERGTWYKVEVGPVGDRATALKLCKALKERDLECQLVQ